MEFCQIAFQPGFDFGNGYFDNDYGQTLFLDGILMDIMIDNGEIWCKLSALETRTLVPPDISYP